MASEARPLPRFLVLKSYANLKYLRRISKEESIENNLSQTFLYFKEDDITSPLVKFEMERAKKNKSYVHLRCCNNNKYLCLTEDLYIQASAEKPIENDGLSSTMFKYEAADVDAGSDKHNIRIHHPTTRRYAILKVDPTTPYDKAFYTDNTFPIDKRDTSSVFTVLDWDRFAIFPEKVSFSKKEKETTKSILSCRNSDSYLEFVEGQSVGDLRVVNEIFTKRDGYIRIKNASTGKFWKRDEDNYILANSSDVTWDDNNTIFLPIKLGEKQTVALKNMGNRKFCNKEKGSGVYFKAEMDTMMNETKLWVMESVILSTMYGFDFHIPDGRVYNVHIPIDDSLAAKRQNNESKETSMDIMVSYKKTKSQSVQTNLSLSFGFEQTLTLTVIPEILSGTIQLSGQYTYERESKDESSKEITVETTYKAKVPGKTILKVFLDVNNGKCDVPFSYFKRDTYYDGKTTVKQMHDGMYTGVNMFSAHYRVTHEKVQDEDFKEF
ncbi:hypothetical protein F8388_023661 [Cannabis sativa]|uniref:Agglutinin domain-containing protein n=1 Tax=Cannabis sativa TaxID=3483 RepID=A0A7J6G9N6_CANSA|nr:hypothetical protein F8388_023661 [Cannabis sativa]